MTHRGQGARVGLLSTHLLLLVGPDLDLAKVLDQREQPLGRLARARVVWVQFEAVEALDAQRFRLRCRTDTTARERWAATAASEGWGLFELQPELRTLEDIFVALTSGNQAETQSREREAA